MKGRKPLPTKLKIVRGTFKKHRAAKNEPKPKESKGNRPPWWLKGYVARNAWRVFSKHLSENGLFTVLDWWALEMLVVSYAKWREASEKAELGILRSDSGRVQMNPLIKVAATYQKMTLELMAEFGMTPSSRARLDIPLPGGKDREDVIEKMMREREEEPPRKS